MSTTESSERGASAPLQYGVATLRPGEMLRLGEEFRRLREHGEKHAGRHLVLITAPSNDGARRCGIICGKRYSKKAVDRNRARRLLKESFRLIKNRIRPLHFGLIPRQSLKGLSLAAVQQDMIRQFQRAGYWSEEGDSR